MAAPEGKQRMTSPLIPAKPAPRPIRCIVLDLDGTTLNARGRLSAANRAAIERAISRGIEVVIASGRSFSSLPEDLTGIPGIRYAITSNGAAIYRITPAMCITRHLMSEASVSGILSLVAEPVENGLIACEGFVAGVPHCHAAYFNDPVKYGASGHRVDYVRRTRRPERDILAFIRAHRNQMDSIDIIVGDRELRQKLRYRLENEIGDIYVTSSSDYLIEASDIASGKHAALRDLLALLEIDPAETAAFGDEDNDAEMLSFVGAGVAVGNATERCRQSAGYITARHDEDGVAQWINAYLPG